MSKAPLTLARIAADIIHGAEAKTRKVSRETAEALARRISDAWGTVKAHDSTGTVEIQENAEGAWYAVWRDRAGVVIAESSPVTSQAQAHKLVNWMRDNAAAARETVIEGKFAEAQELDRTAPTEPPPGYEHMVPGKPEATDE
jgi:uncharacterized protein YegP (UPF0339 family)